MLNPDQGSAAHPSNHVISNNVEFAMTRNGLDMLFLVISHLVAFINIYNL